ncbi:hypothetical protein Ari01nite_93310 [Paractinoplanes rishiriensis]|uniref:Uncharacterized protein n=1 Tax=Paractinoplanes rishiriensis TaxID=1050105 RepID=A0A919K6J5_9ACTN|nr:hypothetical protein Ari01nite_93310 [Actinoplanes rishiriensis]
MIGCGVVESGRATGIAQLSACLAAVRLLVADEIGRSCPRAAVKGLLIRVPVRRRWRADRHGWWWSGQGVVQVRAGVLLVPEPMKPKVVLVPAPSEPL